MLKFLFDKLRQAPGPLKQTRLIVADLAEEVYDLAEYYVKHRLHTDSASPPTGRTSSGGNTPPHPMYHTAGPAGNRPPESPPAYAPHRDGREDVLELDARLAAAIGNPSNHKKQEFKVLAILWDAAARNIGTLSGKAISEHGKKLGLSIRHENVRKVIRMRLGKYVTTRREPEGNHTIFRYTISAAGSTYFQTTYLSH